MWFNGKGMWFNAKYQWQTLVLRGFYNLLK